MSLSYISFVSCIILSGYCIEVTDGAPQKDVHQLNQELQKHGFKTLSSENNNWLLSKTNEILWSECKTHLITFKVSGASQWPLEVDAEVLENLLPQLEKEEEKSRREDEKLKAIEKEKRKMGPPEDMTVYLLKEVLDGLNITYRSNEKKAELIAKVRQARADMQNKARYNERTTSTCSGKEKRRAFEDNLNFKNSAICLFYYDDRKARLLKILFQILFLLEIIGAYLQVLLFQQTITFIVMAGPYLGFFVCGGKLRTHLTGVYRM